MGEGKKAAQKDVMHFFRLHPLRFPAKYAIINMYAQKTVPAKTGN